MSVFVLIPCAGVGHRFGASIPKQYAKVAGKTVLAHTLKPFIINSRIDRIVLIAAAGDSLIDDYQDLSPKITISKCGGATRAETVINGLTILNAKSDDVVLVHDAVRCCLSANLLNKLLSFSINDYAGAILALRATDTIKMVDNNKVINVTLDRDQVYLAQTPQMFRYEMLKLALKNPISTKITDEASALEALGLKVAVVDGEATNIKITYPMDMVIAETLLKQLDDEQK